MSEPKKHHYIPQFLLAQWAVNEGKLWRFTRPFERKIDVKLVPPAAVGFEPYLYTTPGLPPDQAQYFERVFLSKLDSRAARAHQLLMQDTTIEWRPPERSDWTRFMSSLFFRTPDNLAAYKQAIDARLREETPEQLAAYAKTRPGSKYRSLYEEMSNEYPDIIIQGAMWILANLIDDAERGKRINDMVWSVGEMLCDEEFFVSDALFIHTVPLHVQGAHIGIPIGPRRLFVATVEGDEQTLNNLMNTEAAKVVNDVNKIVVSRASVFVGATNLTQRAFVEEHFATVEHETVIKNIAKRQQARLDEGGRP